jgi:tRNA modification GTPase
VSDAVTITLATADQPGAVAILELHGWGTRPLLSKLTGRQNWAVGRLQLADLAGVDEGLAVLLNEQRAQLMPHGGPRVMQKLIEALQAAGAAYEPALEPTSAYPEANTPIEADMLAALAKATSPAAIDLLAAQPALWNSLQERPAGDEAAAMLERGRLLDRLLEPAAVVVVGRPNVGKSTLTNRMLGRSVAVASDLPGTTRDWVGGLAELMPTGGDDEREALSRGVAVHWLDTPGLRAEAEVTEKAAIELTRQVVAEAALVIAMRDQSTDWPEAEALPREPDLWLLNKCDERESPGEGQGREAPLGISGEHDLGLDRLEAAVLDRLGLGQVPADEPWAFSRSLKQWLRGERAGLEDYLSPPE